MSFRQFAPSKFIGTPAAFKTAAERRALIGKRIGYDTSYSSFSQFGRVTGVHGKELEIDGSFVSIGTIQQLVVLDDQETPA